MRAQVLRDLLRLPVLTESGTSLGRISDVEIEPETATVRAYLVSPKFVKGLFSSEQYLITPHQVVSLTAEKMIVRDGVIEETAEANGMLKSMALPHKPSALTKEE